MEHKNLYMMIIIIIIIIIIYIYIYIYKCNVLSGHIVRAASTMTSQLAHRDPSHHFAYVEEKKATF